VYLLVRHDVLDDLTLSGGVRLHRHSLSGTTTIPQAGFSYRLTSSTTLRASVARGFRSPTIRELYLFPAPNPGLLPEDVWTTDLGVVHLTGSSARLEVTGFVSNAKNVIRTLGAYPALRLANSGSWTQRGIESSAEVMIVPPVRLYGTYAYIDVGEMTLANPSHHFALGAQWAEGPFTLSLNMQHVAGLYGADGSRSPLSPYTVFDARGTVTLLTSFSVFVAVENILDRSYQVLTGYPMPGRTVMGGVRCAL
jgi:iron complex outermembrane receptor protein